MRKNLLVVCIGLMFTLAACNGGSPPAPTPTTEDPGKDAPGAAMGTLMGKIAFEGTADNPKIQMKADPKCPQDPNAKAEDYVASDGGLENVIVYISSGVEGKKYPVPTEPQVIDQHGCRYVPHAFTVMTGQPIKIVNSDDTGHNINARAVKNAPFNFMQGQKGLESTRMFDKPEMPVRVKCDVHSWMGAWIGVFDHPYHAVTGKGGNYEIKLPPGKYEVTAWHEKFPEPQDRKSVV